MIAGTPRGYPAPKPPLCASQHDAAFGNCQLSIAQ